MIKYILLGIIQGLTEFLPVSSSGHLVILQRIFGLSGEEIAVTVILHLGTCLALLVFFFKDILNLARNIKLLSLVLVVTAITGLIGISGRKFFEGLFSSIYVVVLGWLISALVLILVRKFMGAKRDKINLGDAVILGLTQAASIVPGVSRSGITVSTLLFLGINRKTAFRFSFLASIPAILGATLLEAKEVSFALQDKIPYFTVGFGTSFISGILALWLLKRAIDKARLHYFGYYCISAAIITLLFVK